MPTRPLAESALVPSGRFGRGSASPVATVVGPAAAVRRGVAGVICDNEKYKLITLGMADKWDEGAVAAAPAATASAVSGVAAMV